jgi:hypothetical protein
MADDRMKNDDLNRQAGKKGDDRDMEKKLPGRHPQDDRSTGQRSGQNFDDEDIDEGQGGRQGDRGGQGNMGQRR